MLETKKVRSRILTIHVIVICFLYSGVAFQTEHAAGSSPHPQRQAEGTALLFFPLISKLDRNPTPDSIPLLPDTYDADQDTPPQSPSAPSTAQCQSFIRFSNYTNATIYIYWNRPDNINVFYKLLASGRQYWQHTYLGNQWHIRDEQGRLIKTVTATRCDNTFTDIYIGDLPACGRITDVALWDLTTDRAVPAYASLTDGTVIEWPANARLNLRVMTQAVIESVKFDSNGEAVINNLSPYSFPASQQPWQPAAGVYHLVIDAYRQNDAQSALCDQRRLTLQIGLSATPTPTATATPPLPTPPVTETPSPTTVATSVVTETATPTTSVTPAVTPTVILTPTPTATATEPLSITPSPTVTPPLCSGKIVDLHLLDLTTGQPVPAYSPLIEGAVIDLATLPSAFNLELGVSGALESVTIAVNGHLVLENFAPYRYPGEDLIPWRPTPGFYTVRAVAYSQDDAAGVVCDIKVLTFSLIQSVPTSTGTPAMTPTVISRQ
ncbi:MAG: hypothetical protein R3E79_12420 [Caldilineaceae bacterium]